MLELYMPVLINPLKLFPGKWNHFVIALQPFWRDVRIHNCKCLKVNIKLSIWGICSVTLSQVAKILWSTGAWRHLVVKDALKNVYVYLYMYKYTYLHGGYAYLRTECNTERINEKIDLIYSLENMFLYTFLEQTWTCKAAIASIISELKKLLRYFHLSVQLDSGS